ncbi:MAG TPA: hypothetical protein VFE65_13155 [Pseudonocardia sp.]|jgi:hypothetical protein|nr:hypothetical protein [Pseudonocardia sp.]
MSSSSQWGLAIGLGAAAVLFGVYGLSQPRLHSDPPSWPHSTNSAAPSGSPAPVFTAAPACAEVYTGAENCAGEPVQVSEALTAATVVLTDGRHVRLAGVSAPRAVCTQAGTVVRRHLEGHEVSLLRPASFGVDESGQHWGYLHLNGSAPGDLGVELAREGLVTAATDTPANAGYARRITETAASARQQPLCSP